MLVISIHDELPNGTTQKAAKATFEEVAALETQLVLDSLASLGMCAGSKLAFGSRPECSCFRISGMAELLKAKVARNLCFTFLPGSKDHLTA